MRKNHPLRKIRKIVTTVLFGLSADFAVLYSSMGRPSIAPVKLLRALLLQAFYSIQSERLLMERLEYDLLFRWFIGIGVDDPAWNHSIFSKTPAQYQSGETYIQGKVSRCGDELARDPTACEPHQTPAVNGAMLAAMAREAGAQVRQIGPVADDDHIRVDEALRGGDVNALVLGHHQARAAPQLLPQLSREVRHDQVVPRRRARHRQGDRRDQRGRVRPHRCLLGIPVCDGDRLAVPAHRRVQERGGCGRRRAVAMGRLGGSEHLYPLWGRRGRDGAARR